MMSRVESCDRCGSQIVEEPHSAPQMQEFYRKLGSGEVEAKGARLCSMCLDDLWEFVFDSDVDRSDKADPIPLERLGRSVTRHIDDLEGILESLEDSKPDGK